jgi:hypothetical protein
VISVRLSAFREAPQTEVRLPSHMIYDCVEELELVIYKTPFRYLCLTLNHTAKIGSVQKKKKRIKQQQHNNNKNKAIYLDLTPLTAQNAVKKKG